MTDHVQPSATAAPTGDQLSYLMDTLSLVQAGDLELSNSYANHDINSTAVAGDGPRPISPRGIDL
jgi:hypothetical protein